MVSLIKEIATGDDVSYEEHHIGISTYLALCMKRRPAREERKRSRDS
jgi:hypothetical protein